MKIVTSKCEHLIKVCRKYTYHIFENGNHEMTIEIQLTEDFQNCSLKNFALATMSKRYYENMTVNRVNRMFTILKSRISEYGSYMEL